MLYNTPFLPDRPNKGAVGCAIFSLYPNTYFKITDLYSDERISHMMYILNNRRHYIGVFDNINSNQWINTDDIINSLKEDIRDQAKFFAIVTTNKKSLLYCKIDLRDNVDLALFLRFEDNIRGISNRVLDQDIIFAKSRSYKINDIVFTNGTYYRFIKDREANIGESLTNYVVRTTLEDELNRRYKIPVQRSYFFSSSGKLLKPQSYTFLGVAMFNIIRNQDDITLQFNNIFDNDSSSKIVFFDANKNVVGCSDDERFKSGAILSMNNDIVTLAPENAQFFGMNFSTYDATLICDRNIIEETDFDAIYRINNIGSYLPENLQYFQLHSYQGYYYNKSGQLIKYLVNYESPVWQNNALGVTPLLRLYPDTTFKITNCWKDDRIACRINFFDGERKILGPGTLDQTTLDIENYLNTNDLISIAPKGSVYFSVAVKFFNYTLICNRDISTYYDPVLYNTTPQPEIITTGNVLYQKKWYCCGDSYTEGDYNNSPNPENTKFTSGTYSGQNKVYSRFIALRNNMDLRLLAKCGATCGAWKEDVTAGTIETPTHTNTFYHNQYPKINEDNTFDGYITMWFGINDSGHCNIGTIDDEGLDTFYGSLNWSAINLITNFPLAHLGFIVSFNCNSTYQQAVREVAQKWAIPYLDTVADIKIPTISGQRNSDSQDIPVDSRLRDLRWTNNFQVASNNGHPNEKAHEYESYFIENWLRSL